MASLGKLLHLAIGKDCEMSGFMHVCLDNCYKLAWSVYALEEPWAPMANKTDWLELSTFISLCLGGQEVDEAVW